MNPNLPTAPYMFKAQLDYLVDAGYRQIYMVADCSQEGVLAHTSEGQISFAIQAGAVRDFKMDAEAVSFSMTISGRPQNVYLPWDAVIGVFPPGVDMFGIPAIHDIWGIEYIAKHRESTSFQVLEPEKKVEKPRPKLRLVE